MRNLLALLAVVFSGFAQDAITFTNKTVTITNLEGQLFKSVDLVRADLDGLIWRHEASGGRICYTNLHPDLLESLGVSSNRIDIARLRAEKKAVSDARYRLMVLAEAAAKFSADKAEAEESWRRQAKAAPLAAAAAQKAADLDQINRMQAQYDALEREDRHTRAAVIDQGGYINHVAEERLEDFRLSIVRAKTEFRKMYGEYPD